MPWLCSLISVTLALTNQNSGIHENKKILQDKETQPMKKLTIRYIRYALALLANIGYLGMN